MTQTNSAQARPAPEAKPVPGDPADRPAPRSNERAPHIARAAPQDERDLFFTKEF